MNEEKTQEQEGEKDAEDKPTEQAPASEGKFETTPIIERAREEREKLEAANKKHEELLNRQEEINAKQALGGDVNAGQPAEKPKEETPKEYNDRIEKEISEGKHDE